jgi:hypothetical protein
VPVLGAEGLGTAWFLWRRRPEGTLCNGDGQTGGGGVVIRRRKTTAWWAFLRHTAEKPPGLVQGFRAGGRSGLRWAKRPDGLGAMVGFAMKNQRKVNGWAAKDTGPN